MIPILLVLAAAPPQSCNYGEVACKTRCDSGEIESCYYYGRMLGDGAGVSKDVAAALAVFERGCAKDNASSCNALGVSYRDGSGVAVSHDQALPLLIKSCDLGNAKGCLNAGALLHFQGRFPHDVSRALSYYDKACAADEDPSAPLACENIGKIYREGHGGVPVDTSRAAVAYARACKLGSVRACGLASLANPLLGATITNTDERALAERGCSDGQRDACVALANMYAGGRGVTKDEKRAAELDAKACQLGAPDGCRDSGYALLRGRGGPVDAAAAAAAFKRGCDLKYQVACYEYAERLRNGEGVLKDEAAALKLDIATCARRSAPACTAACKAGHKPSCSSGADDAATEIANEKHFCEEIGETTNCYALARRYEKGDGVEKDIVHATRLYEIACRSGLQAACAAQARLAQ